MQDFNLAAVEQKLGYTFKNKQLLVQAFVHSSYGNLENISDNERMEFLGDAVLGQIVAEYVYAKYPNCTAGQLSKIRAFVVSADGLRPVVDRLCVMDNLMLASGALKVRTDSKKIAANLFEAVLCAIFLDGGMQSAKEFALPLLQQSLDNASVCLQKDSKTIVQEYCQQRKWQVAYNHEGRSGPDNAPTFCCSLWIDGKKVSCGSGSSKKLAEQDAAGKIVKEWRIEQCFI